MSARIRDKLRKEEELRLQSQEDQEWIEAPGPRQLILKMTSEYQTVDHTNKIDHDVIFVRFHTTFRNGKTQTLRTVFKRSLVVHRPPTRHVHFRSYKFGQKNHTTGTLVRSWNHIPVITSQKYWNEGNGLVGHPKTYNPSCLLSRRCSHGETRVSRK